MKKLMYKLILLSGISFSGAVLLNSCSKKDDTATISTPFQMAKHNFETNILDRDLVVPFAQDDGTNITIKFAGLTFHFTGNGTLTGSATAANDLLSVNGTWSMTAAYDKITFAFPTNLFPDLAFMNKEWLITSNNFPIVLTAANGENDQLNFSPK